MPLDRNALATSLLVALVVGMLAMAGLWLGWPLPAGPGAGELELDRLNDLVREATADLPAVSFADYPAFVGEVGSDREKAIRRDGVHLSDKGIDEVSPWIVGTVLGLPKGP